MELGQFACLRVFVQARQLDLINNIGTLTARGLDELSYARTIGNAPWEPSGLNEEKLYFPHALQARRRST
jgi:hypothetical protein